MSGPPPEPAETGPPASHRVDPYLRPMGRILLGGVLLSVGILLIGVLDLFVRGPGSVNVGPVSYSARGWIGALGAGEPEAIFLLGLVVLVLTPLTRVLFSIAMFIEERDRPFIAMTLFVLSLLAVGALVGLKL